MKTRSIAIACLAVCALVGAGLLGWKLNLRARSVYTDADKIRVAVAEAPVRRILWQPAEMVSEAADADQYEPRVSADGSQMVFVRGRAGANADLYQRRRTVDGWSAPEAIAAVNTATDELGPELSRDGKALYFYSDRAGGLGGYDIWVSRHEGSGEGAWSEPVNLGPAINSAFNDYGPALGLDGVTLYFSSNRPRAGEPAPQSEAWTGTMREQRTRHDYDLYHADLAKGEAAAPMTELNTGFDEGAPAMSPAGDFLYFASDRPGGQGGFDVYRSRLLRGVFQAPEGLGTAINTAANELDPAPSTDGFRLYFSADRAAKGGGASPVRYALWSSASREVFVEAEPLKAGEMLARLWNAAWPWLLLLLLAALLASGLYWAMHDATMRQRMRQLSLMAKCVLLSLLIHAAILAALAAWKVGSAIGEALSSGTGVRTAIGSVGEGGGDGGLAAQVRGTVAAIEVSAPDFAASAPGLEMQEFASTPVMITTAPASLSILPPSARLMAEESTAAPRVPEVGRADVTPATAAVKAPSADGPQEAVTEARRAESSPTTLAATGPAGVQGTAVGSEAVRVSPDAGRPTQVAPMAMKMDGEAGAVGGSAPTHADSPVPVVNPAPVASGARVPGVAAGEAATEATGSRDVHIESGAPAPVAGAVTGLGSVAVAPQAGGVPSVAPMSAKIDGESGGIAGTAPAAGVAVASTPNRAVGSRLPSVGTGTSESEASGAPEARLGGAAPAPIAGTASGGGSGSVSIAPTAAVPKVGRGNVEMTATEAMSDVSGTPGMRSVEAGPRLLSAVRLPDAGGSAGEARGPVVAEAGGSLAAPSMGSAGPAIPVIAGSGAVGSSVSINPGTSVVKAPAGTGMNPTLGLGNVDATIASAPPTGRVTPGVLRPGLPGARLPTLEKDPPPQPAETFAQRAPEVREKVLEKAGGSKESERAVMLALEWFKRHQSPDGRWSGDHFDDRCGKCTGAAEIDSDASMTGMALLCFLGAGHTQSADGPYRDNVSRAIRWLVEREDSNGDLRRGETMYSQTIAAVALCEAYAMTRDRAIEGPARRAVEFVAKGPSRRDARSAASDTSVLGWQIMAIKSAERAGFSVPTAAFDAARKWLDQTSQRGASGRYGYRPGEPPSAAATAEAMFVQQLLGHTRDERRMAESARFILNTPPVWKREAATHYWYYATLAMFQQQGDSWKQWNAALVRELLANQHQEDGLKGSWDPQDQWSRLGGRVYQTAVCTLSLEVYYRYRVADEREAR